jgi:hypothetical protein
MNCQLKKGHPFFYHYHLFRLQQLFCISRSSFVQARVFTLYMNYCNELIVTLFMNIFKYKKITGSLCKSFATIF